MGFFRKTYRFLIIILTLAVGWMVLADAMARKYTVPILMYHNVEVSPEPRAVTVSPENFAWQMDFLAKRGFSVISLNEFIALKKQGVPHEQLPRKTVVLTFDDGYENNITNAVPILLEHGFSATFFVSPGFVDKEGFLNWDQMKVMADEGMDFGSHGMSQGYLPGITRPEQMYEIQVSKSRLEEVLGKEIKALAYPVGGFDQNIKKMVKRAGYDAALTTNRGVDRFNDDLFEINRIRLSDKDNTKYILMAKFSGYYNLFRDLKKPF